MRLVQSVVRTDRACDRLHKNRASIRMNPLVCGKDEAFFAIDRFSAGVSFRLPMWRTSHSCARREHFKQVIKDLSHLPECGPAGIMALVVVVRPRRAVCF